MRTRILFAGSLVLLLAGTFVYAQHTITAKIDFPFMVEAKVLPAGNYEFVGQDSQSGVEAFNVMSAGKVVAMVKVVTWLASEMHPAESAYLVFDVVGDKHFLSEIWVTGEDGYLVHATKGKHTHKVVNIKP